MLAIAYKEHGEALYKHALRLTGNPTDADDLRQQCFVALGQYLAQQKPPILNLRQWLSKRLIWVHSQWWEDCKRRKALDAGLVIEQEDDFCGRLRPNEPIDHREPTPEQSAISHEKTDQLKKIFARLTVRQREVIQALVLDGLSYNEAATQLGISYERLCACLCQIREVMRAVMKAA